MDTPSSDASRDGRPALLGLVSPGVRRAGMVIGLLLLVAAVVMVWLQQETVTRALRSIGQHELRWLLTLIAILIASMVINLALTGALFSVLIARYGKVGFIEMQALIASATLMNYVPLRPGLFSRIAYHKLYNNIAIASSAKTVVQAMLLSVAIAAYLSATVAVRSRLNIDLTYLAISPLFGLAALALLAGRARAWIWAAVIRYAEFLVIAVRYWAAFALIGSPIEAQGAIAFACISVIASMIPLAGNGLGLREWAVGLVAPLLTSYQVELGITADLLNRAGEMLVALVMGAAGTAMLMHDRLGSRTIPSSADHG